MHRTALSAIALLAVVSAPAGTALAQDVASASQTTALVSNTEVAERHGAWTAILAAYVKPGDDGLNRFDYGALAANAEDTAALKQYIASFETLDFSALNRDEAFAAWANLYNAVTIDHIIGRYPVKSIRSGYLFGPWKEVMVQADGREMTLDDIEHAILRVEWSDPRVHYAVNCASIGCPNLGTKAWEGATLDAELDIAARAFVNNPRGVVVLKNGLQVSRIYKWFREDFGDSDADVVEHLKQYAEPELLAQIEANPRIRKHAYDWDLNDIGS